jgi:para-aminobenzoate synthetase
VRTLLVDNHDSFTWNLAHLVAKVAGRLPHVVRNDDPRCAELDLRDYDAILVSPGPGRPERDADFGWSRAALTQREVPVLGVCLGFQGLCHLFGGAVRHAPEPMHGRTSAIHHVGDDLFAGLPSPFEAVRYHSLCVPDVPDALRLLAWTADGLPMAVRHRDRPLWGVQFHPESVATAHGEALIRNWMRRIGKVASPRKVRAQRPTVEETVPARKLDGWADPESVFVELFAGSRHAFWIDGAKARWTYLGDASGPRAEVLTSATFEEVARRLGGHGGPPHGAGGPVPFDGGLVGWLGYELGREGAHRSDLPDVGLIDTDRVIAFDHAAGDVWLVGDEAWQAEMADRLARVRPAPPLAAREPAPVEVKPRHGSAAYRDLVRRAQAEIVDGETYEVCLTNRLTAKVDVDPLELFRRLRRANPVPHAAFVRIGDVAVCSASPETFLRIDRDGTVTSRPIKGTAPRGSTPEADASLRASLAASEKNRAENLMIVDLVRNDLGVVCEPGSVHVPGLFEVETYAVHQLVSTVRGRLRSDRTPVDAIRAAFPGGSMTGAPKERTMRILDGLEGGPRGIYSGALGWLGRNGAADLGMVIRTAVVTPGEVHIGVGGAVVALSDPDAEVEEMWLKSRAVVRAIGESIADPVTS